MIMCTIMRGMSMRMRIIIEMSMTFILAWASHLPSPREAVGRGRGWGALTVLSNAVLAAQSSPHP
jgi:hypothetical protein